MCGSWVFPVRADRSGPSKSGSIRKWRSSARGAAPGASRRRRDSALELIGTHRAGGYAVTAFAASPGPRASGMAGGRALCSAPSPNPLRESYDLDALWAQDHPDVALGIRAPFALVGVV
jgi:hypothetical protein